MFSRFVTRVIQLWLRVTGRKVRLADQPWLGGPQGDHYIGETYYADYAKAAGFVVEQPANGGLLPDFSVLASGTNPPQLNARVAHFYEHTAEYSLDVWSEWYYPMKPF